MQTNSFECHQLFSLLAEDRTAFATNSLFFVGWRPLSNETQPTAGDHTKTQSSCVIADHPSAWVG